MKYEHEPRPEIEYHYHIKDLIEGQEKRTADRNYHRQVAKDREERQKEIEDAKDVEIKPFWCKRCEVDFNAVTEKEIDSWSESAWYKTKHKPCGTWCVRFITDKWRDAYWTRSKLLARDRDKHFADTIQPYETNFNLLYGKR